MARKKKDTTIAVAEGVYLKKIGDSEIWHYHFTVAGKAFRRSTKTTEQRNAARIALNDYEDALHKKKAGVVLDKVSFKKLLKDYLVQHKGQSKYKYHSETAERHILPFFKKVDDVSKLTTKDMIDYNNHRQEKSGYTVATQTINRENSVLRQLVTFGKECGWIKSDVKVKRLQENSKRRRHFTLDEYRTLYRVARTRASEFGGKKSGLSEKKRALLTQQHWSRNLLRDVIVILSNTGMRVGELSSVTWRDIDWDNSELRLREAGKTRSSRKVVIRESGIKALKRIQKRRQDYIKKNGGSFDNEERVQCFPNGTFVASFKKGFDELLKACGFKYANSKDKHALTSLRHSYATFRLTTRKGKRASMRGLAKQMGTSDKMIERHYGHDDVSDYKEELIG